MLELQLEIQKLPDAGRQSYHKLKHYTKLHCSQNDKNLYYVTVDILKISNASGFGLQDVSTMLNNPPPGLDVQNVILGQNIVVWQP